MSLRRQSPITPALLAANRANAWKSTGPRTGEGLNCTTVWVLACTTLWLGGVGTNPECAVKSSDKFLTSPSGIQVEIREQGKVPGLKF
jgi:hypothetical protein